MQAILKGGPVDGRKTNVDPRTKKINVPMLGEIGYGHVVYRRTDAREDGAVIFRCKQLNRP